MKRDMHSVGFGDARWMICTLAVLVSITALFTPATARAQIDYSGFVSGWGDWGNTAGGHAMLGTKQGDALIAYSLGD